MFDSLPGPVREALWSWQFRLVSALARRGLVESFAYSLQRQLRQAGITHVVDIGANRGQFGHLLRRIGFRGRIISVEPIGEQYAFLRRRSAGDGNWTAHQVALGEVDGASVEMHVMANDVFSSLLAPSAEGRELFAGEIDVARRERIVMRRADALLPDLVPKDAWPTMHVKVDTQGLDGAVLRGFGSRLLEVRSLQVELTFVPLYGEAESGVAHLRELLASGLALTALVPVARDAQGRILEADALFLRPHAAGSPRT
jgi:FkbM family methyltransferase